MAQGATVVGVQENLSTAALVVLQQLAHQALPPLDTRKMTTMMRIGRRPKRLRETSR